MNEEHHIPTIKRPTFDLSRFEQPTSRARNGKEALIEEIVEKCRCRNAKEERALARRIAVWVNTTKADETDLHALLQKHRDPHVRNYGALVNHLIKIRKSA